MLRMPLPSCFAPVALMASYRSGSIPRRPRGIIIWTGWAVTYTGCKIEKIFAQHPPRPYHAARPEVECVSQAGKRAGPYRESNEGRREDNGAALYSRGLARIRSHPRFLRATDAARNADLHGRRGHITADDARRKSWVQ